MVKALESLLQQRRGAFDYILIETTGLADPGPVAAALWTDTELEAGVCLDAIVTVVDARNILRQLDEAPVEGGGGAERGDAVPCNEAERQVACADMILVNKVDLVGGDTAVQHIQTRLRAINGDARTVPCTRCVVDVGALLNTGVYSSQLGWRGEGLASAPAAADVPPREHARAPVADDAHEHDHPHARRGESRRDAVGTVTLLSDRHPLRLSAVREWMDGLLWEERATPRADVLRAKAMLWVEGEDRKHILQAVHDLYDIVPGPPWRDGERRCSKVVLIGRRLDHDALIAALHRCGANAAASGAGAASEAVD